MKKRHQLFLCFPEKTTRFFILRVSVLLLIFLLQLSTTSQAQNNTDHETENQLKKTAATYFDQGDYANAYPIYSQLLSLYSHDPTYNYRFGACLLFVKADKNKAVKYLRYAAKQPGVDNLAYYYLGRGLHLNYQFDEAIQFYQKFEQTASSSDLKKYPVNYLIEMCKNGKTLLATSKELDVLRKKQLNLADFYRAYNMHGNGGSLISEPDEFKSKVDKEKKVANLMYLTPDKTKGFFSSYGNNADNGKDIYMITRKDGGAWSTPVNVGNVINTPSDEDYPVYDAPRNILYFASKGHNSMGGYDIFSSVYDDATNTWSAPVNLDFPINTPDDDILLVPDTSGQTAFFASTRSSPQGKIDVYKIALHLHPPESELIAGTVHQAGSNAPEYSIITVRDSATNKIVAIDTTSSQDGKYSFNLPKGGKYNFTVEDSTHKGVSQAVYLAKAEDSLGLLQNIQFDPSGNIQIQSKPIAATKDSALALQYIQNQAQMNVNVDTNSLQTLLAQNNSANSNSTTQNTSSVSTNNNSTTQNGENTTSVNSSSGTNNNTSTGITQNNTSSSVAKSPDTANAFQLEQDKQQLNDKASKATDYASDKLEEAQQLQEQVNQATNNPNNPPGTNDSIAKWTAQSKADAEKGMEAYQLAADYKSAAAGKQSQIDKIENNSSGGTPGNNQNTNTSVSNASAIKVSPGDLIRKQAEQVQQDSTQLANSNTEETGEIKGLQQQSQEFTTQASQTSDPQQKAALQQQADDLLKSSEQKQEEVKENTAQLQQLHDEYTWLNNKAQKADSTSVASANATNNAPPTPSPELQNEINAYAISNGADSNEIAASNNNQENGITGNATNPISSNNSTSTNTSRHLKHSHRKPQQTGNIAATNSQAGNPSNTNDGNQNTQVANNNNNTSSTNGNNNTTNNSQPNNNNNGNQNNQITSIDNGASSNNGNNNSQANNGNNGNQNTQVTSTNNNASSNNGNNNTTNTTQANNNNNGNQNTQVANNNNSTSSNNGNNNTTNNSQTTSSNTGNQNTQVTSTDNGTSPNNGNNNTMQPSNSSTNNSTTNSINSQPDSTVYYKAPTPVFIDSIVNIYPKTNVQNNSSSNPSNSQGPSSVSVVQYDDTVPVLLEQKSQNYFAVATSLTDTVQIIRNQAQAEPDKNKSALLYRKADSINGIVYQLNLKGDNTIAEANTHQYIVNSDQIANIVAQPNSNQTDKIATAQSFLKDADDSYRKALAERDSANNTSILANKLTYIESAKRDLTTAILKQEKATYIYFQVDSIQAVSNGSVSNSDTALHFNYSNFLKTQGKITPSSLNNSIANNSNNSNTGITQNVHPNNTAPVNTTANQNTGNVQPSNSNSSPGNLSTSNTNNNNTTSTSDVTNNIGATNNAVSPGNSESTATSETANIFKEITKSAYSNNKPIPKDSPLPPGLIFGIQIGAFRNAIPQNLFKGFEPIIGLTAPEGYVRYIAGLFRTLAPAKTALTKIRAVGYPQAFIVAYYNGKRITIQEALAKLGGTTLPIIAAETPETNIEPIRPETNNTQVTQVTPQPVDTGASTGGRQVLILIGNTITPSKKTVIDNRRKNINAIRDTVPPEANLISNVKGLVYTVQVGSFATRKGFTRLRKIKNLYTWTDDKGVIKYNSGTYNNVADARAARDIIVANTTVKDAFVTAYYNGKRITPAQASQILNTGNITVVPSTNKKDSTIPPPKNLTNIDSSAYAINSREKVIFTVRIISFGGQLPVDTVDQLLSYSSNGVLPYKDEDGTTTYYAGNYPDYAESYILQQKFTKAGFASAIVVPFYHGKKISVQEAQAITNK